MKTNERINAALLASTLVLLILFIFQAYVLIQEKKAVEQRDELLEYWYQKNDSLLDANIALSEKYWDLKDSLIIIKFEK